MRELRGVSWPKYGRMLESECRSFESYTDDCQLNSSMEDLNIDRFFLSLALDEDKSQEEENENGTGFLLGTGGGSGTSSSACATTTVKAKRILSLHKRQPRQKAGKDPFRERLPLTQQQQQAKSNHSIPSRKSAMKMYAQFEDDDEPLLDWSQLTHRRSMQEQRRGVLQLDD